MNDTNKEEITESVVPEMDTESENSPVETTPSEVEIKKTVVERELTAFEKGL